MNLEECRKKINLIDDQICDLFVERMRVSSDVAKAKIAAQKPVTDSSREREERLRMIKRAGDELGDRAGVLFTTLFDLSRSYQRYLISGNGKLAAELEAAAKADIDTLFPSRAVVACQGVEGAYSQQACDRLFKQADIIYFRNFSGVFQAVEQGLCEYGILPIENSTSGSVNAIYDLMRSNKFYIVRSLSMPIRHHLLAKPGTKLEDVKEIVSHEQGILQCREFLNRHPGVKITIFDNTAMAAKMVAESNRTDLAAIASANCAQVYGLSDLTGDIQNSAANRTRFICISRNMRIFPGADRISLMLSTAHRPGALYSLISKFATIGVNLTKLESRPIPGREFEFMFYFDLEASPRSPEVIRLLDGLASGSDTFVFLGGYREIV
ncbi:MAG: chorismate mutase [Lentisphaeria bacterium]|nr:chorismate mutase [Lentisphaeria bacterium]